MELFKMAKEAMSMRSKLNEMNKRLKSQVIDVEYKGVKIQVNARNEFLSLNIPQELFKEKKDKIEKVVLAAFEEAREKAQSIMTEESKKMMGNMKFPGLN
ncbi:MAG: YbaB/EbfC family nucleoid-associated protein [Endomicrobium sp.]|jgi:DNA-binding protein YbaB|nr:YbaB/EbfC family nucleoid-associated protein [Endomicrobium sp.]